MCSVARNLSRFSSCRMVLLLVCSTMSSAEQETSGATPGAEVSTLGGAHGVTEAEDTEGRRATFMLAGSAAAPSGVAFVRPARVSLATDAEGDFGYSRSTPSKLELEGVLREYPKSPSASVAKETLAGLTKATPEGAAALPASMNVALLPSVSSASVTPWAPPSVDTSAPGVAPDVSCSADDIVEHTSKSTIRQLENLERFLATEHIQHEEVNGRGEVSQIRDKSFSYMVFVEHAKDGLVFLDEKRDGGTGTDSFPTSLTTVGLVSLGVDVFHPGFAKALNFKCEGLGQWRGKAAWIVYFEQKPDVKSFLRLWETKTKTVEIPLKGRVWVAASSYNVLHVESDLRESMKDLGLMRDHLAIDYGPVNFQNGKTELWLPWYADMYLELHGKRYHHNHTLSNFRLFAVDTSDKIGLPKDTSPPDESPKQPPQ